MSAHNILAELAEGAWAIQDPGTAKALPRDKPGIVNIVTGASGETNTLADPVRAGVLLGLTLKTDGGGDRVITTSSAYDGAGGRTTITLATAGDFVLLLSRVHGTGFRWQVVAEDLAAGATRAEINTALDGITATAAELNMAADNSANVEVVTTTNPIAAAESGTTYFLNSATGFVSTLPAPAAGLRYKFIVGGTPPTSGNHTIVTTSSANVIFGVLAVATEDDVGAIASQEDTISFVASTALPGDWVEVISDGTNWYVTGCATVAEAITTTQASA